MTEYVCITNLNDLASAIKERNEIERAKLKFEKEVFEFNKKLSIDNTTANVDVASAIASLVEKFDNVNKSIEILSQNDAYFKKEIDNIRKLAMG